MSVSKKMMLPEITRVGIEVTYDKSYLLFGAKN